MKFRISMFIVILSSFTFLGLGCKGLSPTQTAAITPVEINYWTVFDDVDVLRQFAEQYKVIRPYVTVNIRQVRYDDFDNRLINALADDIQPDIVSIHVQWLRKYLSRLDPMPSTVSVADVAVSGQYVKNVQVDVYDQRMPSVNAVKANYINTVYDDAVVGNRIYGLPLAVDTLAIYYNKRLLDRAGIATPPTTWDEFLSAVQKTTLFNSRGELIQSGVALGTADNIDNFA
ncbi:MAG: extracellular solute-binding protein, partial [Candidatus Magasanikbacteria bacterium]|nr:extracellular solute-binding protein [Candidatus Magasanikbacteria bacterium]